MADDPLEQLKNAFKGRGFELAERLGVGASGTVYKAVQNSIHRPVAIKIFSGLITAAPQMAKRFRRESIILGKLDHPSIPFVLTAGTLTDAAATPYHVMQFVDGEPLSRQLERRRQIPCTEALHVARQVIDALAHAAEAGIVHRDIAPDNILVTRTRRAFLVDFSIGMTASHQPGLTRTTEAGSHLGRAAYASPEQRNDSSTVDARTDIYAMGVVLFEMLSGSPELRAGDPDYLLPEVPRCVRLAIRSACSRDPQARPSHAEFLSQIDEALAADAVSPSPSSGLALCPNPHCRGATWSERGYLRGPKIQEKPPGPYCSDCGTRLLHRCTCCQAPFPSDLSQRYSTKKGARAARIHCAHCGTLVLGVPSCAQCTSLLLEKELDLDTAVLGCGKCRKPPTDPDAPF